MTCDETRRLLDAYLDGELELTRRVDVETHLAGCPVCRQTAEETDNFNSFIRMNIRDYKAPLELKSKIRASLRKESKARFEWLFHYARPLAYAAAALVLSFGLVWTWGTLAPAKDQDLVAQAIANHSRSLMIAHLVDVTSSDQHIVKPWFTGKLDYSPPVVDLAAAGYTLVGGRIDILDKRPVAAIVYQHGVHAVNLFVWPVAGRKIDLDVQSDRGYHYCGWSSAGLNYLCVSEMSADDLEAFEDQVREHTHL